MEIEALAPLTQFGVAGLMGVLWVWERSLSRRREAELNAAHQRLMKQHQELRVLVRLVRQNTRALERFDKTQGQLKAVLEEMREETRRRVA